ncbi:MAG: P63C domain-containing protein [Alphaproteobacteria bacterium]|nr:P63C domain-containing protein [Alphaproteobacteria bacterium]MBP7762249.1 P63C domain-containing protein [Alphaproteobacteria bacterium]
MSEKILKATHEGEINIGNSVIPCAVLENGERVITQSGFMRALGRARQAKGRQHYKGDVNLPAFITAQNLKPFVSSVLEVTSSQKEIIFLNGNRAFSYSADLLPEVCDVFIKAERAGALKRNQKHIADQAHIIMKGLAHVGIAGLIDEATGYQEVRDKKALQAILDKYLQDHARKWAKTFPDEFWIKLIKVKGYPSYMALKRPSFVGHWVNDIIYDRIKPGIRKKLNELNPRLPETGRRKKINTQYFTEDYGLPELKDHLKGVMILMDAAGGSEVQFNRMLNRALPKYGDTIEMPLEGDS